MTDAERRGRIDDLCDAALDRDLHERAAFVAAACAGDLPLLKEVETLLAQAPMAERFLATPISALAAQVFEDELRPSFVGRQIGSYIVTSLLGAGGMGDVYRARDARLGRDVAIKVLPDRFVSLPGRLARFELEARVLAALNHPNVAAIYGSEEVDGIRGLVLELVEGETLAERLRKSAVPVREAMEFASQIVNALEVAHENGIIHRDLKPANIKITPARAIKVLDFGLAKVFATDEARTDAQQTLAAADHSFDGVIAGTTAYMSPEQARGQAVDKRTDIWAFGCVLYEMLTGRPAFGGETTSDTVAAILEHQPDLDALPLETPSSIRRLIQRCLEKDARRRLRDIGDARLEIGEAIDNVAVSAAASPGSSAAEPHDVRVHAPRAAWLAAATGAAVLAIGSAAVWNWPHPEASWRNALQDSKVTRLTDFEGGEHHAAISRDGKFVAFLSDRAGAWDVWVNQIGTGKVYNLTNGSAPELRNPATRALGFSPDGALVSVWTRGGGGTVDAGWVIPTLGGPLQRDFKGVSELDWSRDDGRRMVYHPPTEGDPLFVTEPGEKVGRQIYVARPGFHNHFPVWSHDGAFVYFVHGLPLDENDIWRIRPDGSARERMTFHNTRVSFPTVLDERTVLYLATDREGSGPSIYALDIRRGISHRVSTGLEQYTSLAASGDGRRVVATLSRPMQRLWRVPLGAGVAGESQVTPIPLPTAGGLSPRVGRSALVYRSPKDGGDSLWRMGTESAQRELWNGANGRVVGGAAIAPDRERLAFVVQAGERTQLYVMNTDGTGTHRLTGGLDVRGSPAWSPDGRWLAIAVNQNGEPRLVKIPLDNGTPVPLVNEYSIDPTWSPSGDFLVYSGADVGTRFHVRAVRADGVPLPMPELILTRGARRLVFLREDTLVFMKGDISHKEFWSLNVSSGRERQLTTLRRGFVINDFDISPDGSEIVFDRSRDESDVVLFELKIK